HAGAESTPGAIAIEPFDVTGGPPSPRARWYHALVPIIVTLAVILWLIISSGKQAVQEKREAERAAAAETLGSEVSKPSAEQAEPMAWRDIFGSANTGIALQYGAIAGLAVAGFMAWMQKLLSYDQIISAAGWGASIVLPAIA